jgi:hypothetical protein
MALSNFNLKDRLVIGSIAGMIAAICKDISNLIFYLLKLANVLYIQLAASAHLLPANINTPLGYFIGIFSDLITGGSIGILCIILLSYFGTDCWWYKGFIIGNLVWLFGLGVILNLGTIHFNSFDPAFRFLALIDHQIFGLIYAYTIYLWSLKTKQIMK